MYIGNGVTRKFLIPSGYSGEVLYLLLNGQYVKMTAGTNYELSGGYAVFSEAVPSGVQVCFDMPSGTEASKMRTTSYTVIYGDGTIRHVDQDPVLLLEEAQKTAGRMETLSAQLQHDMNEALRLLSEAKDSTLFQIEQKQHKYLGEIYSLIDSIENSMRDKLAAEVQAQLTEVSAKLEEKTASLQNMQAMKLSALNVAAEETAIADEKAELELAQREFTEKCCEMTEAYAMYKSLKTEMEELYQEMKYAAETIARDIQLTFNRRTSEELEILKSLRQKMETDYAQMNTRLNHMVMELERRGRNCNAATRRNTKKCGT